MVFLKDFLENVDFEKKISRQQKKSIKIFPGAKEYQKFTALDIFKCVLNLRNQIKLYIWK